MQARWEHVKCEIDWARHDVECDDEHLVKFFQCLNLVDICHSTKHVSLHVYRRELNHDVMLIVLSQSR